MSIEDTALRSQYPLYNEWCRDDEDEPYDDDPYARAEAEWEWRDGR